MLRGLGVFVLLGIFCGKESICEKCAFPSVVQVLELGRLGLRKAFSMHCLMVCPTGFKRELATASSNFRNDTTFSLVSQAHFRNGS